MGTYTLRGFAPSIFHQWYKMRYNQKIMLNKHLNELFELLSIPTISAQTKHAPDMKRACEWLQKRLKKLGFTADILPTNGQPVVYAENLTAGSSSPTVLIYGHYDVQSPDPLSEWSSEPFKPEI